MVFTSEVEMLAESAIAFESELLQESHRGVVAFRHLRIHFVESPLIEQIAAEQVDAFGGVPLAAYIRIDHDREFDRAVLVVDVECGESGDREIVIATNNHQCQAFTDTVGLLERFGGG